LVAFNGCVNSIQIPITVVPYPIVSVFTNWNSFYSWHIVFFHLLISHKKINYEKNDYWLHPLWNWV
jgi:hypothetical protein